MTFNVQLIDGCIVADYTDILKTVRSSGLRSKKTRKIMKRWKLLVHQAINAYIDKESA